MLPALKISASFVAVFFAIGCADRQKQAQQPVVEQSSSTGSDTNTSLEADENLDAGSDPLTVGGDVFPLNDGALSNAPIDPSTQGLANSSTLAAGTINHGNNGASGGGINNAAMMQGMMSMMTAAMSGQQPNPAALMGMFGGAIPGAAPQQGGGAIIGQMMPLLMQGIK